MALQRLLGCVYVMILDTVLLARLLHYGGNFGVVGLNDPWEEMVGCLVVQSACEHSPEPATGGIVLSRGNLQLCPTGNPTEPLNIE